MKRVMLLAALAGMFLIGCPNSLTGAKISMTIGRAVLGVVQVSVHTMLDVADKNCKTKPSEEYDKCMVPTRKAVAEILKAIPKAKALFDTGDAIIKAVEAGKDIDLVQVAQVVRKAVCFATKVADYLPKEYKDKVEMYLKMLETYTCDTNSVGNMNQQELLVALYNTRAMLQIMLKVQG